MVIMVMMRRKKMNRNKEMKKVLKKPEGEKTWIKRKF